MRWPTQRPESRKTGSAVIRAFAFYVLLPMMLLCVVREFAPAKYFPVTTRAQAGHVFTVNTTADTDDGACDELGTGSGNKDCSLRDAIRLANNTASADTINFNLTPGATITLTIRELLVSQSMTIIGPGADKLTVHRSDSVNTPNFSVLNITAGTVSVTGLTISGGSNATLEGGGIRNRGTLTVNDCIVTDNTSEFGGNGIYNHGQLTVNDSIIVTNTDSGGFGGGIFNDISSTTTINRSKIANNTGRGGGGIYNRGNLTLNESTISGNTDSGISGSGIYNFGSLTITNSAVTSNTSNSGDGAGIYNGGSSVITNTTISGNSTTFGWGGGIFNSSSLSLAGVTITKNRADVGGGIFDTRTPVNIVNTIVAGNDAIEASPDTHGAYVSQGYNLVGNRGSATTGFGATGDQVGTFSTPINAKLAALAENGGLTKTHKLLAGSPAIDKGICSRATPQDQRGVFRYDFPDIPNADGGCDIGAYELEGPLTVSVGDATITEGTGGVDTQVFAVFQVSLSRPSLTPLTVHYASDDFTATAGTLGDPAADYEPCNGDLQFPAGIASQTISCRIGTDDRDEPDELFFMSLSNPTGGASLANSVGFGLILDDDATPRVTVNDVTLAEPSVGQANAIFNVSLSAPSNRTIIVNYATADGTATAGNDYEQKSGTLIFQPGTVGFTVPVGVNADSAEEPNETFFFNLSVVMNADLANSQGVATIGNGVSTVGTGDVIISELRLRGPMGAEDEFIELYNNTNHAITVAVTDNSDGWALVSSDGVIRFIIPTGTTLPARSHYLAANDTEMTGYSLSAVAVPDTTYRRDIDDDAGVALFNTANVGDFVASNRLDAVGFSAQLPALFTKGTPLTSTASANGEYSFIRKQNAGRPADTGDNSRDFVFVSTDGGLYGGAQSTLGAPGPENSQSPVSLNVSEFTAGPVDPAVCDTCGVNRERSLVSDPLNNSTFGTLAIRRTFTNNTGRELRRLRFRIVDLTTYPAVSPGLADLRVLTSGDGLVTVTGGATVLVHGTVLEDIPSQGHGGGLNSSLALPAIAASSQRGGVELSGGPSKRVKSGGAITLAAPLAPGQSVSVQFLLGVQQTGSFRFYINVEALP
jgi:CSLREA domain-containing protein